MCVVEEILLLYVGAQLAALVEKAVELGVAEQVVEVWVKASQGCGVVVGWLAAFVTVLSRWTRLAEERENDEVTELEACHRHMANSSLALSLAVPALR